MHDDDFKKGARGEFRGDFTRDTFDPFRHFSRVLMQQGRVQLDADWNEQVSIFNYYMRTVVADLIGPHGVPPKPDGTTPTSFQGDGFKIVADGNSFKIHEGHYYVNGILCENDEDLVYHEQEGFPFTNEDKENPFPDGDGTYLVYLDVWERHLTYVEDDYMREKALAGPDTATRAKIVWQVKVINHKDFDKVDSSIEPAKFKSHYYEEFLLALAAVKKKEPGSGQLRARARKKADDDKNPCSTSPESRYRGPENQLYRVEIHKGGNASLENFGENAGADEGNNSVATFKWSRENGSVIFPIIGDIEGKIVTLEHLGRDSRFGLKPNDWVEIVDDDYILRNRANPLLKVESVDKENFQVTLSETPELTIEKNSDKHPYLRRWDQKSKDEVKSDGMLVKEGDGESDWIPLEDGVEIQFPKPGANNNQISHVYQTGDYWLIPARTATGDVEWPGPIEEPAALTPQGVEHHYAPLCKIELNNNDVTVPNNGDLRRKINKLWT